MAGQMGPSRGEVWYSSDSALAEPRGCSGPNAVIPVVQVPSPHSAIGHSSLNKGHPCMRLPRELSPVVC